MSSRSNAIASSSSTHPWNPRPANHDVDLLSNDDSSSEDETEDEDGAELTPAMDAAILRTLAKIRQKDGVYGTENILQDELQKTALQAERLHLTKKAAQKKAFTLQDHQRLALLNSDPSVKEQDFVVPETIIPLTNVQEERLLRKEVTNAFHSAVQETDEVREEEEGEDFLKKAEGEKVDVDKEAYRKFLLESGGGEDAVREILGLGQRVEDNREVVQEEDEEEEEEVEEVPVKEEEGTEKKKSKSKKKEQRSKENDDEFLMNYILNRGWVDEDALEASTSKAGRAAAFESEDEEEEEEERKPGGTSHPWGALEEEDEFDEKAEEFETAYNFRFEEPGAAEISSHPRNLPSVVRRPDDTRKLKRQARLERKEAERLAREEETRRLKGEKRREIEKRLEALRKEVGEKALMGLDLDKDWDEEEHDQMMRRMMAQDDDDEEKPSWGGEDEGEYPEYPEEEGEYVGQEGGNAAESETGGGAEAGQTDTAEEGPIDMDADFIAFPDERKEKKKKRKEKKRKNKENRTDAEADDVDLEAEQSLSVEAKKEKVKKALEEYKSLDHHGDMIGDMPTRFKYAETAPVSYGLTPTEILLATESELNAYIGLKHFVPYRDPNNLGASGRGMHKRLQDLKRKLSTRKWGDEVVGEEEKKDGTWKAKMRVNSAVSVGGEPPKKKKRMGKNERTRLANREGAGEAA